MPVFSGFHVTCAAKKLLKRITLGITFWVTWGMTSKNLLVFWELPARWFVQNKLFLAAIKYLSDTSDVSNQFSICYH